MQTSSFATSAVRALLGLVMVICGMGGMAMAGTHTWTGAGANVLWSNAANWTGGVPTTAEANGTIVVIGASTTTTMDISGLVVDSLHFTGAGNTLNGTTTLGISGAVVESNLLSDKGTNTLAASLPLKLATGDFVEVLVGQGATLTLAGNISSAAGSMGLLVINGASGTLSLAGTTNTYAGSTVVNSGILELNSSGVNTGIPGALRVGAGTANKPGNAVVRLDQTLEINDTAAVTVQQDGVLDLNGSSETIGSLTAYGSVTLGSTQNTVLTVATTTYLGGGTISGGSATALHLNGDVTATSSTTTGSTIQCATTLNATTRLFTVNSGAVQPELTLYGLVSDGTVTPSGIKKMGDGTMDLLSDVTNTYSGITTVDKGVLRINAQSGWVIPAALVIGNSADTYGSAVVRDFNESRNINDICVVTLNASGVLDLAGNTEIVTSVTGTGSILLGTGGDLTVGGASASFSYAGSITGAGKLEKGGTGTMTFTGSCGASSTTIVNSGTLLLNSNAYSAAVGGTLIVGEGLGAAGSAIVRLQQLEELPDAGTITVNADGLLDLANFGDSTGNLAINGTGSVTLGGTSLSVTGLTMTGGTLTTGGGLLNLAGDVVGGVGAVITGNVSLNALARRITVLPYVVQPEMTINGLLSDGTVAGSGLVKSGSGTLYLQASSTNPYSGATTVDRGVLRLNASSGRIIPGALTIGNNTDPAGFASVVEFNLQDINPAITPQINASGVLNVSTFSETLQAVSGTGQLRIANGGQVSVANNNNDFTFDGSLNGDGQFIKLGTGTVTLTGGSDSYGGTINVSAGTLLINGLIDPEDSVVTVATGATLGGTGTFGAVTSSTGTIAPGAALPGSLACVNEAFINGSTMKIRINDAAGEFNDSFSTLDELKITGTVLQFNVTGTPARNVYIVASYGLLVGNPFTSVTGIPAGYTINYAYTDGGNQAHIALVGPETVTTGGVTNVTAASAKLGGTINPAGKTTGWYFQYGLTNTYGSKTPLVNNLSGTSTQAVSATISGLNSAHLYHYQLVAVNAGGTSCGADATFTTGGPLAITESPMNVSALSLTLTGFANPKGNATTAWFEYGTTASLGTKTPAQPVGSGVANVSVIANLTKLTSNKLYYYRMVATNAGGTSRGDLYAVSTLVVLPPVFQAGGLPVSRVGVAGKQVSFNVIAAEGSPSATDAPLTYQWNKNGVAVKGATAASYVIPAVAFSQVGVYTCVVKNLAGSITSTPAQLGVVDGTARSVTAGVGTATTITVTAAGNYLFYQWERNGQLIPGATGKSLTLPSVQLADDAVYVCEVHGLSGFAASGEITLNVVDAAPTVTAPAQLPHGIVGGNYEYQIPVDPSPNVAATSYSSTVLPTGLKLNAATGLISGRITAAANSYPITLKAANLKGTSPGVAVTLVVDAFPTGLMGTYNGLVDRDPLPLGAGAINGGFGGTLSITVSATGGYTGKLTLAGASYPLTGVFLATVGSTSVTATQTITRTVALHNLTLAMAITGGSGILQGTVNDATVTTPAAADHFAIDLNPWSVTHPTSLATTYTARLSIKDPTLVGTSTDPKNLAYPQGSGFATVIVTPAGVVTWIGKMADGTAPTTTYTTTMAMDGTIPVHLMLAANTGSAHGLVTASPDTMAANNNLPLLDGTLGWNKVAPAGGTSLTYPSIPLFDLTVAGGQYVIPAAAHPVLSFAPNAIAANAKLAFTDGGLAGPPAQVTPTTPAQANELASQPVIVSNTNVATFPAGTNHLALTLALNVKTGAMSGGFTLVDGAITRKVTYTGLLVPRLSVNKGVGYFLMKELPANASALILSGQVLLEQP